MDLLCIQCISVCYVALKINRTDKRKTVKQNFIIVSKIKGR